MLQWRPQDFEYDYEYEMPDQKKKAAGNKWGHPKRKTMCGATGKVIS
jgi:hypothetical protein